MASAVETRDRMLMDMARYHQRTITRERLVLLIDLAIIEYTPPKLLRTLISIDETVRRCGVSRRTVYNWMEQKRVEYCVIASGTRRIYQDTLFKNVTPDSGRVH